MSEVLANDVRAQYDKAFENIRKIVVAFPDDKWLAAHGDEYYIPCRIAYHLAVVADRMIGDGFKDPDFASKLPYGAWMEATAATLPPKDVFLVYFDGAIERAKKVLAALNDEIITGPIEPERAWMGATQIAAHLYAMRELSAHTGELNKMLIENGEQDIWVAR